MDIRLPGNDKPLPITSPIILIGANGAGKTRMCAWIESNNKDLHIQRITAQKSLAFPEQFHPTDQKTARDNFKNARNDDDSSGGLLTWNYLDKWGGQPNTHELDDFAAMVAYIATDTATKSIEYRSEHLAGNAIFSNTTIFERIKEIWEQVITDKTLSMEADHLSVKIDTDDYNCSEMSVGERNIFYLIAQTICADKNSLLIIDEPENHLHRSILLRLWDALENARPDCVFLYATHDLEFVSNKQDAQVIWVKSMPSTDEWEYEILQRDTGAPLPDALLFEVLGSRKAVILVEGGNDSWDRMVYQMLFPDSNVIPVGSCAQVIQYTKALRKNDLLVKHIKVSGVIDRDCRSDDQVSKLANDGITCISVAEIENMFLLPSVLRLALSEQSIEDGNDAILSAIQDDVIGHVKNSIDDYVFAHVKKKVRDACSSIGNNTAADIAAYKAAVANNFKAIDIDAIEAAIRNDLQDAIGKNDYLLCLRYVNDKGLYDKAGVDKHTGLTQSVFREKVVKAISNGAAGEATFDGKGFFSDLEKELGLKVETPRPS
ncbi:MAG: DUF4435 domain-containing protein [Eggerthellaceae bacterium]|nr:DUF4435 domain-containing protein [Eggerthellaceae bacterium]